MARRVSVRFSTILGERKLHISKVSHDTGISRTTLTNLYYGTSTAISFDVLKKLCDYFQCDIGNILTLE